MKTRHQHSLGNLFIVIGIFCLILWGYQKYIQNTNPHPTLSSEVALTDGVKNDDLINPTQTLSMGVVELAVKDLKQEVNFYHDIIGFDTLSESGNSVDLGENGNTFLRLVEEKEYSFAPRTEAGLYHIAITHNSRKDLAERVKNILIKMPKRFQGSADHSATEAFYFSDPEGNGLELYYDKPRKDWVWKDGKPTMGTLPLDTENYIKRFAEMPIGPGRTSMGHVHLKVGNIPEAEKFYRDVLLFEVMNNRGDALFVSRDKYHHHLGMNTWESLGAGKRTRNTFGLKSFELIYHDMYTYEQVRQNLRKSGYAGEYSSGSFLVSDPWGNEIMITLGL